ncbi:FAD:protein FMN transferase [Haploplasma axanthum]|uniref:FAD:protein FMN transferase n=1 Tax=Haploplasma axanthum TaxID=29552 RepID=A0A449BBD0_HAPAX|nr:FAD:protein FMN transferase [Haploplasma axanthum]VEU79663.1 Thiamine biosynthesis lipoprotein ApbE precursor [Haploplasma axanthum]
MIKKFVSIITIVSLLFIFTILTPIKTSANELKNEKDFAKYYDSMSTSIAVVVNKENILFSENELDEYFVELFNKYHYLTSNFKIDLTESSIYKKYENLVNVNTINDNPNTKLEISKELYDILIFAENIKQLTDEYFDISIGKIIDKWKWLIELDEKLTNEEFEKFINEVKEIPIIKNGIILETENDKFYITIKDGVKIDLGALAKGYVVQLASNYLTEKGLKYFKVTGSNSSLSYGENPTTNDKYFNVGVTNGNAEIYGRAKMKNSSITTSGDTAQGVEYNGRIYHHIISPKTKMPEDYNRLITLISDDAGYADALTTALFSMDDQVREKWIQENSNIEYLLFKTNGTVINTVSKDIFSTIEGDDDILKTSVKEWLIISGVIIIAFLGFFMISKAFKKSKYQNAYVVYRDKVLAVVHFTEQKVETENNQEGIPEYNNKTYPIINLENKTITILGDYEIDGIRQELVVRYDFEKHSMQIIEEQSPKNICSNLGESTGMELVCVPNNIKISFGNGSPNFDDTI